MVAAAVARLPRLTLFTGPNCSLCDVAKAELAKVKRARPFHLETINIQDVGQEKWKKKYVYWIPALHLEGKEIAKGRWDAQTIIPALNQWDLAEQTQEEVEKKPNHYWQPNGIYVRATEAILGTEGENDEPDIGGPTCFNCGDRNHIVSACPEPYNRELVTLSRQLYSFLKETYGGVPTDFRRIHEVEGWRQQRLEWLNEFVPGEVHGSLLREALGGQEDYPWLANMAIWGYPKGWVSVDDPREKVEQAIWNEGLFVEDEPELKLVIFQDEADDVVHDELESLASESACESEHPSTVINFVKPVRWAEYPPSHFSSQLLPIYNGFSLPPVGQEDLLVSNPLPPPPMTSPPPLPPSTPPPPLPPEIPSPVEHKDSDMEMSDSDSD